MPVKKFLWNIKAVNGTEDCAVHRFLCQSMQGKQPCIRKKLSVADSVDMQGMLPVGETPGHVHCPGNLT